MPLLKVPVSTEDHSQGPENAPLTLVEYGDYECPHCGTAYQVVKKLQHHFGDKLRFVFRNFPLKEMHPHAEMAAEAAEFAGKKGHYFEMHDLIYENQQHLSLPQLLQLGEKLHLPINELSEAIEKKGFEKEIQDDFIGGVRSGVNGTPTFYINDHRYNGPYALDEMMEALEKALTE